MFSFDILAFLNIGCMTRYSYFEKFTFAFAIESSRAPHPSRQATNQTPHIITYREFT